MKMKCLIALLMACFSFLFDSIASEKEWDFRDFMINAKNLSEQVALQAIRQGHVNSFIGNPGIFNSLQKTPLTALISGNTNVELIKKALATGANVNQCGIWKEGNDVKIWYYPLELALQYGQFEVANLLLDHGADPTLCFLESTLMDVLSWSKTGSVIDCVKLLINLGANPRKKVVFRNGEIWKYSALEDFQNYLDWQKSSEYENILEILRQPYVHPNNKFFKKMFYSNA